MVTLAQPTLVDYSPDEIAGMERRLVMALQELTEVWPLALSSGMG